MPTAFAGIETFDGLAAAAIWWALHRDGTDEGAPRAATLRTPAVPVMVLSVLTGALATYGTYRAGHTGAEAVWKGEGEEGRRGPRRRRRARGRGVRGRGARGRGRARPRHRDRRGLRAAAGPPVACWP